MSRRWQIVSAALIVVFLIVAIGIYAQSGGASPKSHALVIATPCPSASPGVGTPLSNSPAATASPETCAAESVLGTPLAVSGLVINLTADDDYAGPLTLTVDVHEGDGTPVTGAKIMVAAEHLDMNMGKFPHDAFETEPGRYVAENVGMGMGGEWRVEVDVKAPDGSSTIVFFRVELEGPM